MILPSGEVPIGLTLNNPADIMHSSNFMWRGEVKSSHDRLAAFDRPYSCLRAMAIILRHYVAHDGCKTVSDIIHRYAPPSENNTPAYLSDVCARQKWKPDYQPHFNSDFPYLMYAMCWHEMGRPYVSIEECVTAWRGSFVV